MYNTNYESKYSTGDRTKWIEQVHEINVFSANSPLDRLVNGDYKTNNSYFLGTKASETEIVFKMKRALVIDEFTWYQSSDAIHGKWKLVRLDSLGNRLSLGEFTLGGSKKQKVEFKENIGPSHTYILEGVSGTTSTGPYIHQIDFKAEHHARILVQLNGVYGYFKDGEFIPLEEQREPTYEDYQNFGMPDYREFKKEEWKESEDKLKRVPWSEEEDGECFIGEVNLNLPENKKVTSLGISEIASCGFNGPGPQVLIAGDCERGFYGEVDSSEMFTAEELSSLLGITQGKIQFNNTPWLKWAYKGKTLFRPKKTFRHSISWSHINSKGAVYGEKVVENEAGYRFDVRLMKSVVEGKETAEGSYSNVKNSEWNDLMLPIHEQAKDASWAYPQYVEEDVPYWGIDYTDEDLHTHNRYGNGTYVWCQEHWNTGSTTHVSRGSYGVSNANNSGTSSGTNSNWGWAPVLELLTD